VPVKIIHPDHVEIVGLGHVLLTAPHASSPDAILHTGQIVEEAALTSRSFAVIGKVNKEFLDLTRMQSAQSEMKTSIEGFITDDGIRYILHIRGKEEPGVEVGTIAGQTCSDSTIELVRSRLANDFIVAARGEYGAGEPGTKVTSQNPKDVKDTLGIDTIQIQFGQEERQFQRENVVRDISEIADILNTR
jgi:hypothetical protein